MFGKVENLRKLKNGMEMTAFTSSIKEADATKLEDLMKMAKVTGRQVNMMYFCPSAIQNIVQALKAAGLFIYANDYQKYIFFDSVVDGIKYRITMEYEGMVSCDPESDLDEIEFYWRVDVYKR